MPRKTLAKFPMSLDHLPVAISQDHIARLQKIAERDYTNETNIIQALADRRRLKVLEALSEGELCACVLVQLLGLKPSALSYHLSLLTDAGLIKARRDGSFQVYSLTPRGRSALELVQKLASHKKKMTLTHTLDGD